MTQRQRITNPVDAFPPGSPIAGVAGTPVNGQATIVVTGDVQNAQANATAAAASATAAATSATNAAASATTASNAATSASGSATTSTTNATNAANSASSASTSATNAAASATSASSSASSASTSATNAANSASSASTSATNAAASATSASGSATSASTSATNASTSATNAASSATTASNAAANASTSATTASTAASNAAASATAAVATLSTATLKAANLADLSDPLEAIGNLGAAGNGDNFDISSLNTCTAITGLRNINGGGLPIRGYQSGCQLTSIGTLTFGVTPGAWADDTGVMIIQLAATWTKNLNAAWAAGSTNGCLDTGSGVVSAVWYHIFLIYNPTTLATDILASQSITAPSLPTGFTAKRRIFSLLVTSTPAIYPATQHGDEFLWANGPDPDWANYSISTTAFMAGLTVPNGVNVNALITVAAYNSTATTSKLYVSPPDTADVAVSISALSLTFGYIAGTAYVSSLLSVRTNTASQVRVRSDQASNAFFYINTHGYIDTRGRLD